MRQEDSREFQIPLLKEHMNLILSLHRYGVPSETAQCNIVTVTVTEGVGGFLFSWNHV